jgi:hypothetical protein
MSVQSSAQIPLGLASEPPVSLPSEDGPELRAASAPAETPQPLRPPLEAQLVQQGKLSMGQLAQAHRDRLEKGGSVLDIVVERGWVSAEDVAALRAEHGATAPAPQPIVQAAPQPEPEASQQPVTEPETAQPAQPVQLAEAQAPVASEPVAKAETTGGFRVAIRLSNGELVTAGEADNRDKADALGQAVVADLATADGSWPFFDGRYLRLETIVSVDIVPTDASAD